VDEEFLSDCQLSGIAPGQFTQPLRFPPASPFPPGPGEWNALTPPERPQHWSAQQKPCFLPAPPLSPEPCHGPDPVDLPDNPAFLSTEAPPPLAPEPCHGPDPVALPDNPAFLSIDAPPLLPAEPCHGPDPVDLPDNPAFLSIDAPPRCADTRQSETSDSSDTDPQGALTPTPRRFPQVNEEFLSDCQPGGNASGQFTQSLRFPPTSPLPPKPSKRNTSGGRRRASIVFIILVVLLILAGGSGSIIFLDHLLDLNSSQTILKTSSINSAANTNPYVSRGTLVFSDTLKAANSNWDQNAGCAFKGGSYHVTATTIQSCTLNANVTLTNFVLEVKVTLLQGNVGGFFFRENKLYKRSNAYLLDFDGKGNYQLWNYSTSRAAKLIDYGFSSYLSTGYNKTNIIALVVQGSSITLHVNGHMIKRFIDGTYSSGGLSLISSEYAPHTGVSEAAYSDLRLWQL
jgi:hypothetical protein